MTRPEAVGKTVFYLVLGNLIVALFLGVSRRGEPLWEPARLLFVSGGGLLILLGGAVVTGHAVWIGVGRDRPVAAGMILALVGLGVLGAGLHAQDADGPWRLLALPGLLVTWVGIARLAVRGPRSPVLSEMQEHGAGYSPRMIRAAMWMCALFLWPAGVAWSLGLLDP